MKRYGFLRISLYVLFLSTCTYFLSKESSNSNVKMSSFDVKSASSLKGYQKYNSDTKFMLRH